MNRHIFYALFLCFFMHTAWADNQTSTPFKIGVNPWIGTGLFYIAQDQHFFNKEGVNVELVKFDDGSIGKQMLTSNKIDLFATTPETVIVLADAGADVKVIGILDSSHGADGIVAASEIKNFNDLKNKKVALEVGSSSQLLLSFFLKMHGMNSTEMTIENMSAPDAGAAFVAGRIDAAVTWEPWLSKASLRPGGHILVDSSSIEMFPDFYIMQSSIVKSKKIQIQAVLRAVFDADKFYQVHPNKAVAIIAKNIGISEQEAKKELNTIRWINYNQNKYYMLSNPSKAGQLLQESADLWYSQGLSKKKLNTSTVLDAQIIDQLYS